MDTSTQRSVTAHRAPRTLRGWRWGIVGLAVVLAAGGAVGASAAPSGSAAGAASNGVGTLPPLPPPPAQNQAAVVAGAVRAAKPKLAFEIPVQVQRVYASYKIQFGPNVLITDSAAYVLQAPGPDPVYGIFPDVRKTVLGFGAIPVTATIRLTQTSDDTGTLNAINVHNVSTSDDTGKATGPSVVTGQVLIQVTDVTVDQVPLDVGPDCVGSRPIDLVLNGFDTGNGLPTDYNPFAGGPLQGTFTIPPFTGCGVAGQDLDPLFSGTISGPDNLLVLEQGPLGEWDPTQVNDCRDSSRRRPTPCATPPAPALPIPPGH